ncbi:MAG: 5-(carboxyamino)imidazole ribonucleotide synthase [Chitinophagaceae bacterium]
MKKIGILGGGQLGKMLLQAAANYPCTTFVLEDDVNCPSASLCHHFIKGSITNFNDVVAFGKLVDVLTIEIENVNIQALEQLENEGLNIIPKVAVIKTIKNKISQKQFYKEHQIPSPEFVVTNSQQELVNHENLFPAVHKIGEGGYDGKGVQVIETSNDFSTAFNEPSVLEKKVEIDKEIAIMVAMDTAKKIVVFPPVLMVVNPYLNLLDYQISPIKLEEKILFTAEAIAFKLAQLFNSPGVFAIEMFIDKHGEVWVNETAPRVHNSGHHTIEANYCSQFDMLIRILLDYPLGDTQAKMPSAIVNIVGTENEHGEPNTSWMNEVLKQTKTFVHWYGKKTVKPGRKMGHITILGHDIADVTHKASIVKGLLNN